MIVTAASRKSEKCNEKCEQKKKSCADRDLLTALKWCHNFSFIGADPQHKSPESEQTARQEKTPKPIGELTCEVCMRAIDNIYADINALAKEYANQHGGATPGADEGEDLVQRGLENACAGVKPKKVYQFNLRVRH